MKSKRPEVERALKARDGSVRFFLLYGPDDSGSRSLVKLLADSMPQDSERIDLSGADLRADPARLADEAASLSLFGGARYVVVEQVGEESVPAVEALLQAPAAGNPVLLLSGALKPTSRLAKLALAEPAAMALASYVPEGREADRMVMDMGREQGLTIQPDIARRLADASAGNRAMIALELQKFALYLDAAPERPQPLDHEAIDAVGAASEGGDLSRLVDSVGSGDPKVLESELLRLSSEGIEGIVLIRSVLRRIMLLARLRGEVEKGNSVSSVMASQGKSIFWKEKDAISLQLSRWRADLLAKAAGRLLETERQVKAPGGPGPVLVDEELFAICRQAARLR